MFPYRRGANRKRSGKQRRRREGGRRLPNNPQELLTLLQPATKALAQVLAGQARPSGQIVHARNVLAQAERLLAEGAVERMPPARREEFHEQLARLKLTVTDYESQFGGELPAAGLPEDVEEGEEDAPETRAEPSAEKLRALALALAASTSGSAAAPPPAGAPAAESPAAAPAEAAQAAAEDEERGGEASGGTRGGRLRLRLKPRGETGDAA